MLGATPAPPPRTTKLAPEAPDDAHIHRRTIRKIILEDTFRNRDHDPAYAIGAFMARVESVARTIPPERLLIYEIAGGWKPLCDFLGVPIPLEPFPHRNSTEEFLAQESNRS